MALGIWSSQLGNHDSMPFRWPEASYKGVDAKDAEEEQERTQRKSKHRNGDRILIAAYERAGSRDCHQPVFLL
jgi:hypothetical protein